MMSHVEGKCGKSDQMVIDTKTYKAEIKAAVDAGNITQRQAKRLKRVVSKLQDEMFEAWAKGEDVEVWVKNVQAEGDEAYIGGMNEIHALGDPVSQEPCLVGNGRWLRVKNGVTMDSGCSVFVMPSNWLKMFPLRESEGSRRRQEYTAAAKYSEPIVNEGQKTIYFVTK